jgi:hypothetical protein
MGDSVGRAAASLHTHSPRNPTKDVSFGYRRVLLSYNFGMDAGTYHYGDVNLTATGASDSNRGVVLQAHKNCHTRYGGLNGQQSNDRPGDL